ncbi:stage II sporulation protein R [Paludicola sp. MB14-C6]|uniref:stage II sporulation protein R n=1 Tax=Paludihabitans sp. MB14-C6 TaxID=3070656 RepID=UPI0027DC6D2D|nr:stage II sporulation protein R [Paludicola sp. MB14-C6]WMJ22624.1 stage II sporulation protein R [Paludicola sp. MB14-C6]
MMKKQTKINIAIIIGLLIAILVSPFSAFAKECNTVRNSVLRLHILANSNSQADQQLKLAVRDKILELDTNLFDQAKNLSDAKIAAEENLELIQKTAQSVVYEKGYTYHVKASVVKMFFNTREYSTFTLPAGQYHAVRVTIGEAKGDNWWCVLYPPLCVPAATSKEKMEETFTKEELNFLKNNSKYEVRFASVELFERIKEKIEKSFPKEQKQSTQSRINSDYEIKFASVDLFQKIKKQLFD